MKRDLWIEQGWMSERSTSSIHWALFIAVNYSEPMPMTGLMAILTPIAPGDYHSGGMGGRGQKISSNASTRDTSHLNWITVFLWPHPSLKKKGIDHTPHRAGVSHSDIGKGLGSNACLVGWWIWGHFFYIVFYFPLPSLLGVFDLSQNT